MQIIKDERVVDDTWCYQDDDGPVKDGDVILSLERWLREKKSQILKHKGRLGIRIMPGDNISELAEDLEHIDMVELYFPEFADGRLFSQAWLLRSRYRYQGELRANGHYIPDQAYYLSRVGVDTFVPEKPEHLKLLLSYLSDFSVKYQTSVI